MKLPLILVTYMPKKWQEKYIQKQWDEKTDEQILDSFDDATKWIDLSFGMFETPTLVKVAEDCIRRLEIYVLPQMRRRNLFI